jgi:hypothetical protein
MNARWLITVALSAAPAVAAAQSSVSGSVEYSLAQSDNTTDDQASRNGSVWQNYTLGFHSFVVDPRILKYDTEATFRTNRLSAAGTDLTDQRGKQDDLGFRVSAFVLPAGVFPFHVQASRIFGASTGELATANPVRGSLGLQGGDATSFDTENREVSLGGQLLLPGLPRAELSYRRGESIVSGGSQKSNQRNDDLSAAVIRETSRTRQALRYQRTGYEYELTQSFTQRVENLDYDFTGNLSTHLRFIARAGQRGTLIQSDLLIPVEDTFKPYQPPPGDGRSDTQYATGGFDYEPSSRVAMRMNATWDQQHSPVASTDATLASGSLRLEVLRGLAVNASATGGQRGQDIGGQTLRVSTANGVAGMTYTGGPRWLNGTLTATTGQGRSATPEGQRGRTRSWSREASVSSTVGWFGTGAGYERVNSRDDILDYGNYDSERLRGSVNLQSSRLSLTGSAERLHIARGQGETFALNDQQTLSATVSARLWGNVLVNATGGGFSTRRQSAAGDGLDRSLFWGAGAQTAFRRSIQAVASIRNEELRASSTGFAQRGLNATARLEYRLRSINLAVEYRHNDSRLQYAAAPQPSLHRGHQVRVSITRQFGFKV